MKTAGLWHSAVYFSFMKRPFYDIKTSVQALSIVCKGAISNLKKLVSSVSRIKRIKSLIFLTKFLAKFLTLVPYKYSNKFNSFICFHLLGFPPIVRQNLFCSSLILWSIFHLCLLSTLTCRKKQYGGRVTVLVETQEKVSPRVV